ncbi:hypothetical protein [Rossellomorea aquimaris]|uniref:hypothetical protein n=1 Tax=Rossellomorea aquimaris TaxID=189382 RepID=UPI0007D04E70|nr:hypothetical protein [Rossellomorea aquimaris]
METLIFAILIGIISTIFNKVKDASPKDKPVKPTPIQSAPTNQSSEMEKESSRDRERRPSDRRSSLQTRFEEKKKEIESTYQKQDVRSSRRIGGSNDKVKKKSNEKTPTVSLGFDNPDDIVKGFIFSEVLGPPKSKKLHHRK